MIRFASSSTASASPLGASSQRARPHPRTNALLALLLCLLPLAGCVERIMKINSQPPGAVVIVNDEEVGLTPATFSFLWYGDYDIILRKQGYRTIKTHHRVNAPWYQIPPLDFISEHLVIGTIRDEHTLPEFQLQLDEPPPADQVVKDAVELRNRALLEDAP